LGFKKKITQMNSGTKVGCNDADLDAVRLTRALSEAPGEAASRKGECLCATAEESALAGHAHYNADKLTWAPKQR